MTSSIPAVVENHLDAVQYNEDGNLILGSSNLTGRYWNGSLWCFKSANDAPDVEKCFTGIDVSAGICDLVCLDKNNVALGLDSGGIEVYKLETEPANFSWVFGVCEHDDYISSLSLSSDHKSIVTAGADKCIKIWDVDTWSTTATYRPVHGGIIWQVSCSCDDPQMFVSCGQDGKLLLFDCRLPKPAMFLDTGCLKGDPTSVSWRNSNHIAVGDESGLIAIKDIRSSSVLSSWGAHNRRVHRLVFSPNFSYVASCSDDTDVCVTNIESEKPTVSYQSHDHTDFVRSITWASERELVSCGWDKKVIRHTIH